MAASQQATNTIPVLSATITGNQIQDVVYGIYLVGGSGTVSGNSISHNASTAAYGIYDLAPNTTVSNNTVLDAAGALTGVWIGAANASVTSNKITASIGVNFNCFLATVTGNTISSSTALYRVPSLFTGTNSIFNTTTVGFGGC